MKERSRIKKVSPELINAYSDFKNKNGYAPYFTDWTRSIADLARENDARLADIFRPRQKKKRGFL